MKLPIRLGIVGTGLQWTGSHLPAIEALGDAFQIAALCARDAARRHELQLRHPSARVYDTYQTLVTDREIDAIVICLPIPLNAPASVAALDAGKHVFVEKPFAHSVQAGQDVLSAVTRSGRRLMILEQLLYTDAWAQLRAVMDSGEIGEVAMFDHASHGFIDTKIDPWGFGKTSWRIDAKFPLGSFFDGGVHEMALRSHLFGRVERVYARGQNFRPEHGEYDNVNAIIDYANGVQGVVSHSGLMGGSRGYFHIRGTLGLIVVEFWRALIENKITGQSREIRFADSAGDFWKSLHPRMWRELATCLVTGGPDRYPLEQALADIEALEAIDRSIKNGQSVALPEVSSSVDRAGSTR